MDEGKTAEAIALAKSWSFVPMKNSLWNRKFGPGTYQLSLTEMLHDVDKVSVTI